MPQSCIGVTCSSHCVQRAALLTLKLRHHRWNDSWKQAIAKVNPIAAPRTRRVVGMLRVYRANKFDQLYWENL